MFTIGATLAHTGAIPVWAGVWSANFVTTGLGLFDAMLRQGTPKLTAKERQHVG